MIQKSAHDFSECQIFGTHKAGKVRTIVMTSLLALFALKVCYGNDKPSVVVKFV